MASEGANLLPEPRHPTMTEAQLGLIIMTIILCGFALLMRSKGAITTVGAIVAIVLTVVIATFLFVTQFAVSS